jgi:cyclophilin family peptidyl-prolyl cis-trans isomerase/FKBP-type peptidyl-prolyl cis-trans isomerase
MKRIQLIVYTIFLISFQWLEGQSLPEGIYGRFSTNKGEIVVRLEYKKNPMTVANFIGLAEGTIKNASFPAGVPFYNGSVWHRVVKGHVIQGGSPVVDKAPQNEDVSATGYVIPNEITDLSHNKAGMLGMANSGPHTNTCQYYITLADRSYLDGNYTVFGEVVSGMDVVNNIVQGDTTYRITIERIGSEAGKFIVNDKTFNSLVDYQWKNVNGLEAKRKASDDKYITENYPGLIDFTEGIRYRILKEGSGSKPAKGSEMTTSYTGRLINGTTFASTAEFGKPMWNQEPAEFFLTAGEVLIMKGLDLILSDMKTGERRLVVIPPEMAFGNNGFYAKSVPGQKRFVISPGETVILVVTLISVK